jgi:hypothetical protein
MNDIEAFEKWRDNNFSKLIEVGNKGGLEKLNDNLAWCWQAAIENKEMQQINGTKMKQMNDRIEDLLAENKKLREALEFYAAHARDNCHYPVTDKIAREALKEAGKE